MMYLSTVNGEWNVMLGDIPYGRWSTELAARERYTEIRRALGTVSVIIALDPLVWDGNKGEWQ